MIYQIVLYSHLQLEYQSLGQEKTNISMPNVYLSQTYIKQRIGEQLTGMSTD